MQSAYSGTKLNKHFIKGFNLVSVISIIIIIPFLINQFAFAFICFKQGTDRVEINSELLNAIIKVESSNNHRAFNHRSKARGLTQITPIAWKDLKRHYGYKYGKINYFKDIYDPEIAREAGKDYLYILQNYLKAKHIPLTWENLLAAYVWGPNNLAKYGLNSAPQGVKRYIAQVKSLARIIN